MALTEGKAPDTLSYINSLCVLLSVSCSSNALILTLLLLKMTTITVTETTILTIRAGPRELIDIVFTVLVGVLNTFNVSVVSNYCVLWI